MKTKKMRAYILLTNYRESHHRGSDKVDFPNLLKDLLIEGSFKSSINSVMDVFWNQTLVHLEYCIRKWYVEAMC